MRNPRVLFMWVAIAVLSGVLVLRVQDALSQRRADQEQQEAAERRRAERDTTDEGDEETLISELEMPDYDRGDCLTWEQGGGLVAAEVVDCAEPHLIEAIDSVEIDLSADAPFPTDAEWTGIASEHCGPLISDYLTRPLDPFGRLSAGVIHPKEEGWRNGIRMMVCGIQSVTIPNTGIPAGGQAPMTGRAAEVDQSMLFPIASCLDYSNNLSEVVPCTEPHHAVIVGHLDLSDLNSRPADEDLRFRCAQLVATDAAMPGGTRNFLGFDPASWEAGSRMGNCTEIIYDDAGTPTMQPGTG